MSLTKNNRTGIRKATRNLLFITLVSTCGATSCTLILRPQMNQHSRQSCHDRSSTHLDILEAGPTQTHTHSALHLAFALENPHTDRVRTEQRCAPAASRHGHGAVPDSKKYAAIRRPLTTSLKSSVRPSIHAHTNKHIPSPSA